MLPLREPDHALAPWERASYHDDDRGAPAAAGMPGGRARSTSRRFAGSHGPDGVLASEMMWSSDGGLTRSGWAICAAGHASDLTSAPSGGWTMRGPAYPWHVVPATSYFTLTCLLASLLSSLAASLVLCTRGGRAATQPAAEAEGIQLDGAAQLDWDAAAGGGPACSSTTTGPASSSATSAVSSAVVAAASAAHSEARASHGDGVASAAHHFGAHWKSVCLARCLAGVGAMANGGAAAGLIVASSRACTTSAHECAPWLPLFWLGVVLCTLAAVRGLALLVALAPEKAHSSYRTEHRLARALLVLSCLTAAFGVGAIVVVATGGGYRVRGAGLIPIYIFGSLEVAAPWMGVAGAWLVLRSQRRGQHTGSR
jgi:hypothetical protein